MINYDAFADELEKIAMRLQTHQYLVGKADAAAKVKALAKSKSLATFRKKMKGAIEPLLADKSAYNEIKVGLYR